MSETNRIEYKRELTSELDIEKGIVALRKCVYSLSFEANI